MKPRFVDQRLISIPKPGWKPAGKAPTPAPHIIVIAYLDTDGRPWLYDDDLGLRRLDAPGEP